MADFLFDRQKNPEDNIDSFFDYLESIDKELAELLRENILIMPSSDAPVAERNQARHIVNNKISAFLDKQFVSTRE